MASVRFPTSLSVKIAPEIFETFPGTKVAFSLIEVALKPGKKVKNPQAGFLSDLKQRVVKQLSDASIDRDNFEETGVCRSWNRVFEVMKADPDKKSTIINLLRRAAGETAKINAGSKADLGKISNFVDYYNAVSIAELTPMGALDVSKISGDIILRFGKEGETFIGLGRDSKPETVTQKHVVYADDKAVLTWLWNHRDAAHACVPMSSPDNGSSYVLLFADQAERAGSEEEASDLYKRPGDADAAINAAAIDIAQIGGKVLATHYLNKDQPEATLDLRSLVQENATV